MTTNTLKAKGEKGFTIIELMIATTVLSVILLLVTTMMIGIGNLFYKGITQSKVQDDVRNITDDTSQHLQLSSTVPKSGIDSTTNAHFKINVYCVAGTRYSYVTNVQMGQQLNGGTLTHVLWRDTPQGGCDGTKAADLGSADPSSGVVNPANAQDSAELVPSNSRLSEFCIGTIDAATGKCIPSTASPYTITVGIAYGDNDLLCDNGVAGDCSFSGVSPHMTQIINQNIYVIPPAQITCKGGLGDQFCATAILTTTVANRL